MKKRFIAAAVPVLVAGSLAAAAPGMSQAADKDSAQTPPRVSAQTAAAELVPCAGGKQKKAMTGGHGYWFSTTSQDVVPGTNLSFNGPTRGKDTVFVTFTATNTWAINDDYGRVRVQLDGADIKPANAGAEYFYGFNQYNSFAGQYCIKVGRGAHNVRVLLESIDANADGSDIAYLHNPMVHVEVAD
ncbi:MAG: hypothetical protein ACRDO4_12750 [Nocardioides sp.]